MALRNGAIVAILAPRATAHCIAPLGLMLTASITLLRRCPEPEDPGPVAPLALESPFKLAVRTTAANRPDVSELERTADGVPPVRGKRGRPRRRPDEAYADRGFDSRANREALRRRGIRPRIARRGEPHGSGLGKIRWGVAA
jgi:hypothetical protein